MNYLRDLSRCEANHILTAFHRLKGFYNDFSELCTHNHEKDFLCKDNDRICDFPAPRERRDPVTLLIQEKIGDIAADEKFLKHLILEFQSITRNMMYDKTLLFCSSLLINFHKRGECPEYLALALKFKLILYWYIRYIFREEPTTVLKTMMEFLNYISYYKCERNIFIYSINIFTAFSQFSSEDHLQPFLSNVLELAHELHLNFFSPRNKEFRLENIQYAQLSVLHNCKRFLILSKFGYEDRFIQYVLRKYVAYMQEKDMNDLFGLKNRYILKEELNVRKYRPFQVLVLFIQVVYDAENCVKKVYDQVLHVLWESITDPYLTQKHFMSSFKEWGNFAEFLNVWKWYSRIVLKNAKLKSSPRSLKHLARCSIRQILTECVQLPSGVEHLDIPLTLKNYLCLEYSYNICTEV